MPAMLPLIQTVFDRPPIAFSPERQSLKAWAMYCLRDRGFKVIYAQNADFAVETKDGSKVYFSVAETAENLDRTIAWIVHDPATQQVRVLRPTPELPLPTGWLGQRDQLIEVDRLRFYPDIEALALRNDAGTLDRTNNAASLLGDFHKSPH